jgi:SRSO17 transposase
MKSTHSTTSNPGEPSLSEISGWYHRLHCLHQRLSFRFARPEVRQNVLLYLQAILSDVPRKNGWQISEQARQANPSRMQRLLSRAVWDEHGVRDDLRTLVSHCLHPAQTHPSDASSASPFPVLVLDESGFPKRGHHSPGVAPQYCGRTGRVENCQVGVFASYVTALGHALIDRELYLPEEWCTDLPRRRAAHIPDHVSFATKPELAGRMAQRAQQALLPIRWVVADSVYGHSLELRLWLQAQGFPYVLGVPSTEAVCVQTPTGELLLRDVATIAHLALRARDWHRLSQSLGTKGERLFDWARLPIASAGQVDARHFLLIRRCLDDPSVLAFFLVWAPPDTPLSLLVQAIGARWHIEEDLEANKALGLGQYEGRSYLGWYRHLTLVLLASAFLLDITVSDRLSAAAPPPQEHVAAPLLELTTAEARHLLARLFFPLPTSAPLILLWSRFRRTHQYWASYYHRRRRAHAHPSSTSASSVRP